MWALIDEREKLSEFVAPQRTKRALIMEAEHVLYDWGTLFDEGCRAVRVTVTPC